MTFIYGRYSDGSDAMVGTGIYPSPNGEQWSNRPYTQEQRENESRRREHWRIYDHISGKRTMREEYDLIMQKKSELPRAAREYIIKYIEGLDEKTAAISST